MTKKIYYQIEPDNSYSFEYKNEDTSQIFESDTWAEMVALALNIYGQDIEFHEVTKDNWQQLYDSGAFDQ